MHTITKYIAIFVTTALVLNAMAPALAQAARHLQGDQVNANALVQDTYIAITYRDGNDRERTARGWIDAIGETAFTIRSGGLKSKTTIAYAKVLSVIMSEESSVPAKQMNEVNRFIRNKKRSAAKAERSAAKAEQKASTGVIHLQGEQIKADTLSIKKENGLERIAKKLGGGVLVGGLSILAGVAVGERIARVTCDNPDAYNDGFRGCTGDGVIPGALVGYTIGVPIGMHWADRHDRFIYSFAGSMIGSAAGVLMCSNSREDELWPFLIIGPLVGATIMSEFSRKLPKDSRFSIGLAPDRNGNVSAIATLRF